MSRHAMTKSDRRQVERKMTRTRDTKQPPATKLMPATQAKPPNDNRAKPPPTTRS